MIDRLNTLAVKIELGCSVAYLRNIIRIFQGNLVKACCEGLSLLDLKVQNALFYCFIYLCFILCHSVYAKRKKKRDLQTFSCCLVSSFELLVEKVLIHSSFSPSSSQGLLGKKMDCPERKGTGKYCLFKISDPLHLKIQVCEFSDVMKQWQRGGSSYKYCCNGYLANWVKINVSNLVKEMSGRLNNWV